MPPRPCELSYVMVCYGMFHVPASMPVHNDIHLQALASLQNDSAMLHSQRCSARPGTVLRARHRGTARGRELLTRPSGQHCNTAGIAPGSCPMQYRGHCTRLSSMPLTIHLMRLFYTCDQLRACTMRATLSCNITASSTVQPRGAFSSLSCRHGASCACAAQHCAYKISAARSMAEHSCSVRLLPAAAVRNGTLLVERDRRQPATDAPQQRRAACAPAATAQVAEQIPKETTLHL
jgi:hypothetical protein